MDYIGYLTGKYVAQMETQTVDGIALHRPSIKLLINYDHQMRKEVIEQMNEGKDMALELQAVTKNSDLERHFSTPLAVSSASQSLERHPIRWQPYPTDKGKGKHKGKHKGKGKFKGEFLHDGRQLCFAWSNKNEGCKGGCNRAHPCRICLSTSHPTFQRSQQQQKSSEQDGGTGTS